MNTEKAYSPLGRLGRIARSFPLGQKRAYSNWRLRHKFFFIFLIVIILPFSLLIYYSYSSTRSTITEHTYTALNGSLAQINTNVEKRLEYYNQLSNILYMDAQLRNYLSTDYEQAYYYLDAFQYINRTLPSLMTLNANILGITIYTGNHTLYSDGQYVKYTEELAPSLEEQVLEAAGNTVYFHSEDFRAEEASITIARSLSYFSLQHPYGILTIDINDNEFYSLIKMENYNKSVYIIDQNGSVISTGDQELKSNQLFDVFPIQEKLTEDDGYFDIRIHGQERFFTYKKLSNGWATVITVPYDELLANTNKATRNIIWYSAVAIGIAVLLLYFTTKFMTKRIEVLLQQIRKVERGDFRLSIKPMGHDEIGQVSFAFNKMASTIQTLIHDGYVKEIARKESELNTLQAQINPHFLYNTLSSISSLALKEGAMQVYQMVNYLAKYYRVSLNKGKRIILLEQEINLVKNYVAIQKIRFRDKLHMHYDLDEQLFGTTTIKLILQPFIENCINHAIWDESGINIIVKVRREGDGIVLQVIDDGIGMTPEQLDQALNKSGNLSGYGVKNVDDRIKLTYGEEYGVSIFSRLGIGTAVTIRIPVISDRHPEYQLDKQQALLE
ncbi:integral membrane sensor signal transduction histidine kinase [Paenibacillus vortex V453]|uniref:Integral membrane sensor signal transduction histidine kinase n=1 Tax=Paenibacillus vortex V453 TaxID=715225 RepID=A0A2R9SQJ1_9BACL|nr:sensor histidine kinase [Paenibacillus vortex]EFU39640.1 integral membrane sensor signal transduction histidine kinase [Paenibacillus vortex V453]